MTDMFSRHGPTHAAADETDDAPSGQDVPPAAAAPLFDPPTDTFEQIYAAVGADLDRVPWAHLRAHPLLVSWLGTRPRSPGDRALVIACGLGDDAEELAAWGFQVTAFDYSPTAIDWCHQRFPLSTVDYQVADLLDAPRGWARAFDLVVEIHTIQSLPPPHHAAGIDAIAATVAAGGSLFLRCLGREDDQPVASRPWPISRSELHRFSDSDLVEADFLVEDDPGETPHFRVVYSRP
ncbi:MAG: class I SAM-dependent methyltransferase [Nocardioidaceae bacterium]